MYISHAKDCYKHDFLRPFQLQQMYKLNYTCSLNIDHTQINNNKGKKIKKKLSPTEIQFYSIQ